jgi:TatD DNase family protein
MIEWIDAHTHLDSDELYIQKDEVLKRALDAGVSKMLLVNSDSTEGSFQRTVNCLESESSIKRYLSFGIHPHHASQYNSALEKMLLQYLKTPGVIALGEIGLDFYYDYSPRDVQQRVLQRQLELSLQEMLPVVIHCRDGYGELADILRNMNLEWRGMIHCFTGNRQQVEMFLDLGFFISFSGIVTFKTADVLREAALAVPVERMLIETDAPYLAPVPFRGKTNEPAFVVHTGTFLAKLKESKPEEFAAAISANFSKLFQLSLSDPG